MTARWLRPIAIAPAHMNGDTKAMHGGQPSPPAMAYACQTCTRRQVKCDKLSPICTTCHKAKHDCSYQAPPPRKRKRKTSGDIGERLAYYERILQQHGLLTDDPGSNAPSAPSDTPQHAPAQHQKHHNDPRNGRLLSGEGTTRYVDRQPVAVTLEKRKCHELLMTRMKKRTRRRSELARMTTWPAIQCQGPLWVCHEPASLPSL